MKRTIRIQNLDCAHCANKMEKAISKLEGVNSVSINFVFQTLHIDYDENDTTNVLHQAQKICKSIEPDCKLMI